MRTGGTKGLREGVVQLLSTKRVVPLDETSQVQGTVAVGCVGYTSDNPISQVQFRLPQFQFFSNLLYETKEKLNNESRN